MKKSFYSIGSIIILLLAALIFVAIPAMSGAADAQRLPDYGSYNGKPVRYEENTDFYNAANELFNYYENQGVDFSSEYASTFYAPIFQQAFQNTIGGFALEYFTESTGYKAPTTAVNRSMRKLDMFRDGSGEFSPAIYQSYTETEKRKAQLRVEKTLTQMRSYEDIFGSMAEVGYSSIYGLKPSSAEIEFIRKMGEKQFAFDAAAFDMKNFPEEEKVAFGKAHKDLFVKYNVRVISCESESKAKEVAKRLNNSEITFEDAITEYSKKYYGDPETGVVSANYRYQLSNAVVNEADVEKITSLKANEVSPVVETASGYCVFQATENPTEPDFTDADTVVAAYSYLLTREKSVIEDYYANVAKDFAAKAAATDFMSAAESFGATATSVNASALNYNDTVLIGRSMFSDDPVLRFAVTNENFYKTAYKLKKDEISAPVVLSGGNQVIVLKCTDITNGGTPSEDARTVIAPELDQASKTSINYSILASDKIKDNSAEFMKAFNGNKS